MSSTDEKIQDVIDEIAKTPSNKATQGHLGRLKAKLAKFEEQKDLEKSNQNTLKQTDSGLCGKRK